MKWLRQRNFGWLPTIVVLVVVLLAGSRLIALSVQHHAAVARESGRHGRGHLRQQDRAAAAKAGRSAEPAGRLGRTVSSAAGYARSLESLPPAANTFWMTSRRQGAGFPAGRGCRRQRHCQRMAVGGLRSQRSGSRRLWVRCGWAASGSSRAMLPSSRSSPWRHAPDCRLVGCLRRLGRAVRRRVISRGWSIWAMTSSSLKSSPAAARSRIFVQFEHRTADRHCRGKDPAARGGRHSRKLLAGGDPAARRLVSGARCSPRKSRCWRSWRGSSRFGTHDLTHALQRSRAALATRAAAPALDQSAARGGDAAAARVCRKPSTMRAFMTHSPDCRTGAISWTSSTGRCATCARKRRQRIAVIIIDIVRFKLINDMLGSYRGR